MRNDGSQTSDAAAADADGKALDEAVAALFPGGAPPGDNPVSRRRFLQLLGASMALAGYGCSRSAPPDEIVPYVTAPAQIEPGRPTFFSTTMPFNGYGRGVLVLSREGRPIKIEGNPDHPASLGAADVFMQASILDLYDPDRAKTVTQAGVARPLSEFHSQLADRLSRSNGGRGVRLLTRTITSPTLVAQLAAFKQKFPHARWHIHDPSPTPPQVFEQPVDVIYDLSRAKIIVSLGSDFLFAEPGSLRYARQFADMRRVRKNQTTMSRLYVAESVLSMTGSMADHRIAASPTDILSSANLMALGIRVDAVSNKKSDWTSAAIDDLKAAAPGTTLVIAGLTQPPAVHALAHEINQRLGNVGSTVHMIAPVAATADGSLAELVADIKHGDVDTLLILDGNPAYDSPADRDFDAALSSLTRQVNGGDYTAFTAHLGSYANETSFACQWQIPMAHWLESWGDARAFDGTASLIQPLIAPLYNGVTASELLDAAIGDTARGGYDILREHWKSQVAGDFDTWWLTTLQKGIIADTQSVSKTAALRSIDRSVKPDLHPLTLILHPDPTIWTGDCANNAWLQELPKPFTKLTWDNAIGLSPATAKLLQCADGDVVELTVDGRKLRGPVIVIPGQADNTVTLSLGYGRSRGGSVLADGDQPRGCNAYALQTSHSPWAMSGADIQKIGEHVTLATAQNHHAMAVEPGTLTGADGIESFLKPNVVATLEMSADELSLKNRKLIRTVTLDQYKSDPRFMDKLAPDEKTPLLSLFQELPKYTDLQWGMTIDTSACMGCNACVIACQAENNIPVVGKAEVIAEREMHWIRIDQYFDGDLKNPGIYNQPVPCMHCEDAPCEIVCPVGATTHSPEGINEMTYNRCVGTRFCSNNCPYKVRRFNFLLYSDYSKDSRSLQYNPDVSVRSSAA